MNPFKENKNILIFSPHPDDDVICMGASMKKFVDHGHIVYINLK
jgi:glucosamine-6-phosphate deaminase